MSRKGYYYLMLQHGIDVLNHAAQDVAAFEPLTISVELPPQPGVGAVRIDVEGYFDENPAPTRYSAIGLKASLNGVLYVRAPQTPEVLTNVYDSGIPAGMVFHVRGRKYRCIRADFARDEYAFLLSDMNETRQ